MSTDIKIMQILREAGFTQQAAEETTIEMVASFNHPDNWRKSADELRMRACNIVLAAMEKHRIGKWAVK